MLSPTESAYSYEPKGETYPLSSDKRNAWLSQFCADTEPSAVSYQFVSPTKDQLLLYQGGAADVVVYTASGNTIMVEAKAVPKVIGYYVMTAGEKAFAITNRGEIQLSPTPGGFCHFVSWGDPRSALLEPPTKILGSVIDKLTLLAFEEDRAG